MIGLEFGLGTGPGAMLAAGEGDWEAAMPTWVMMKEAEEDDPDKESETSGWVGGAEVESSWPPHAALSLLPHTEGSRDLPSSDRICQPLHLSAPVCWWRAKQI